MVEQGEPDIDPNVINGPKAKRSFTDMFCCLIFMVFWGLTIFIAIYGIKGGDLKKIAQPYDSDGNRCGLDKNFEKFPFLYFNSPASTSAVKFTLCVERCPKDDKDAVFCKPNNDVTSCQKMNLYKSFGFAKRFCMPDMTKYLQDAKKKLDKLGSEVFFGDIEEAWEVLLISVVVGFLVSFVYCYLLEYCAPCIVWSMIIGAVIAFTAFCGFITKRYIETTKDQEKDMDNQKTYLWIMIISWAVLAIMLCCICCMCSRIRLAIKIIQATADFITDCKSVLTVPIIFMFITTAYIVWWAYVGAMIFSTGQTKWDESLPFGEIKWTTQTTIFWYIHLFGGFWQVAFFLSYSTFVVSTATCIWYFSQSRDTLRLPVWTGFKWGIFWHLGSLAFGSLLLAIVWIVQVILQYIHQKIRESGTANTAVNCMMTCLKCLADCFERFIRFLNQHAYVEIVLRSKSFCPSALNALNIVGSNVLRFSTLSGLVRMLMVFGKFFITFLVMLVAYGMLRFQTYLHQTVFETYAPLIVCFFIGWTVSSLFVHVYENAADSLLHCYCYDELIHRQTGGSARMAHDSLKLAVGSEDAKGSGHELMSNRDDDSYH